MKRIPFLILLLFLPVCIMAQQAVFEDFIRDRNSFCRVRPVRSSNGNIQLQFQFGDPTVNMTSEGREIEFELKGDSSIILRAAENAEVFTTKRVGCIIFRLYQIKYNITLPDLQRLINNTIQRIYIETDTRDAELILGSKVLGKVLRKQLRSYYPDFFAKGNF